MRPVRLELEGFTAFRERTEIDFGDADLFALTGPTGAGKTSIIDAITFALYGSVPRFDDRRAVAPVISQGAIEARVRLDFEVGGVAHTAVRVVRATKSGASTKEARLQRGDDVLAGDADGVTAAVVDLLGLSFEHFTTCVSLPQGAFARFLHDKPRDRQDLLVSLLDLGLYERLGQRARQRAAIARSSIEVLDAQAERLVGATPEAAAAAAARVADLGELRAHIDEVRPQLDGLRADAAAAASSAAAISTQLTALDLRIPEGVHALAEDAADARRARDAAVAADEQAAAALAAAEAALASGPARAVLEAHERDHASAAELEATIGRGELSVEAATTRATTADQAAALAERARLETAEGLEIARTTHRAHALVAALREGEPCPVCLQVVTEVPEHAAPDLDAAAEAAKEADREAQAAAAAQREANQELARVETKLSAVREQHDAVRARLMGAPSQADVTAALALLDDAEAAVATAKRAAAAARTARAVGDKAVARVAEAEAVARQSFDAARDAVAALGPPTPVRTDLSEDWDALVSWAGERASQLTTDLNAASTAAELAERAAVAIDAELAAACSAAGVVSEPGTRRDAVTDALARAEADLRRLEADQAEAAALAERRVALQTEEVVAGALAQHLSATGFEQWVLDEAVQRLLAGGSRILHELSGGAYSLTVDQRSTFCVIDHANAGAVRSARTLSGGETFLASLALALALADEVASLAADGAARLDSIFLDEGFGTLDPETLDVVAAALDELGARGRMVGVVTHVRDLAERLPVRFEVRKVGGTATVEKVLA